MLFNRRSCGNRTTRSHRLTASEVRLDTNAAPTPTKNGALRLGLIFSPVANYLSASSSHPVSWYTPRGFGRPKAAMHEAPHTLSLDDHTGRRFRQQRIARRAGARSKTCDRKSALDLHLDVPCRIRSRMSRIYVLTRPLAGAVQPNGLIMTFNPSTLRCKASGC